MSPGGTPRVRPHPHVPGANRDQGVGLREGLLCGLVRGDGAKESHVGRMKGDLPSAPESPCIYSVNTEEQGASPLRPQGRIKGLRGLRGAQLTVQVDALRWARIFLLSIPRCRR